MVDNDTAQLLNPMLFCVNRETGKALPPLSFLQCAKCQVGFASESSYWFDLCLTLNNVSWRDGSLHLQMEARITCE